MISYVPPAKDQRYVDLKIGPPGSGKSYAAAQLLSTCPRAIVAECDYGEFPAKVFDNFPAMVYYLRHDVGAFDNPDVPFRVSYSPYDNETDSIFRLALGLGNVFLFLEEADRFGSPRESRPYADVIRRGRHRGVSLCVLAQHPYLLPIDIRRLATSITCWQTTEPNDVKWLREKLGDAAEQVKDLQGPPGPPAPPYPYLYWRSGAPSQIVSP